MRIRRLQAHLSARALLFALLLLPLAPLRAQIEEGAVYGRVYCADTQKPARFATVRLVPASGGGEGGPFGSSMTTTGPDGGFYLEGVSPGDYYVDVTLAGYAQPLRGLRPDDLSQMPDAQRDRTLAQLTRVTVLPNQSVAAQVTLYRGGVLSGTVSYDDGARAPGVYLQAVPADPDASTGDPFPARGRRFGNGAMTDDRGAFRLTGLPDGLYTLEAMPRTMFPVFLGNTVSRSHAQKIQIRGGDEHPGLEIQVPVVGLHRVSGTVLAQKDGHGIAHAFVSLRLTNETGGASISVSTEPDGAFSFATVPDGKYTVSVGGAYDQNTHTSYSGASAEVEVSGADAPDIVISLPSGD